MLKYKIIICDDETEKYTTLMKVLDEGLFELCHVNSLNELTNLLNQDVDYDAIFLDLYYKHKKGDDEGYDILSFDQILGIKNIMKRYQKLLILTKYTNREVELLTKLALSGVISEWIDYEDLYNKNKGKFDEAILRIHLATGVQSEIRNGIWMLHLSDLHFGRQFELAKEEVGGSLASLIRGQLKAIQKQETAFSVDIPGLCIISGDLSQSATPVQFEKAREFIDSIATVLQELGANKPVILIAPGNHDFSWRLSIVNEHDVVESKNDKTPKLTKLYKSAETYQNIKWIPFTSKFENMLKKSHKASDNGKWWYYDLTNRFNTRVFVINTAYLTTYQSDNVFILPSLIEEIANNIEHDDANLGILVAHHPVALWGDADTQEELLKLLHEQLCIQLILSGHKHSGKLKEHRISGDRFIIEAQTGSAAANPSDLGPFERPNFRILQVTKDHDEQWELVNSRNFSYKKGGFTPEPVDNEGNFVETARFFIA